MAVPCAPAGDKQVQLRRGTTAENDAFIGADGELSFDTDQNRLRVHDGVTPGGFPLAGTSIENTFTANQAFNGNVNFGSGAASMSNIGTLVLPILDVESLLTVETQAGAEGNVEFQIFNTDTSSPTFELFGNGRIGFPDGIRQTFNPNGTTPGLNVGSLAGDPSTPINGDLWYDSTANELTARINGVNVSLGSGGATPPFVDTTSIVMGSADNTKLLRFEVDGFTTATTRVVTVPNASFTLAGLELNNIFTVDQAIGAAAQIVLNANGSALFASGAIIISAGGNVAVVSGELAVGAGGEIVLRPDGSVDFATGLFMVSPAGLVSFADDVRQIFNPGATVAGLNVGSLAGDPSTPINGDLWYDSTGNLLRARINGATVSLGAGGGTPGGADTQVQFNDSGAFGGDAGFSYNKTTDLITSLKLAIGATPADSFQLSNTTAAAAGAQQYSPALRLTGQGWKTTATAASQPVDWRIYAVPVQGTSAPSSILNFDSSINNSAFTNRVTITSAGTLTAASLVSNSNVQAASASAFIINNRLQIKASADGVMELLDTAGTSMGRVNFGGTTSSFPAIKRNGVGLDFRLADDSAFANIGVKNITQAVAALLSITSGTNQRAGNATLVAGTVTVSNTTVTANTIVMLTRKTSGGTLGTAITYTVSAGTSFTVNSDSALDTSTFSYFLIEVP